MATKNHLSKDLRYKRRRGAVAVMVAASLVVLFIFASFAVDLGHVAAVACEMQNTADGASLAGAAMLRDEKPEFAHETALDIIDRMQKRIGFSSLEDQVIELGTWTPEAGFTVMEDGSEGGAYAVRVLAKRAETPYFFAGVIGKYSTDVSRDAVAVGSDPCNGIWGLTGVNAGSIVTDSYISTEEDYDELTARANGDICSGREITIHGSKVINGDTMPGFGYPVIVKGNSGAITGFTSNNSGDLPDVPLELGDVEYDNDNDLIPEWLKDGSRWYKKSIYEIDMSGGNDLPLPEGTFYFESIKLSGGSTLSITGKTTIYVSGPVDATGGSIVNESKNPHDLTIISTASEFKLGGNVDVYGTILAPRAYTVLNGTSLYGVVVGGYLELKGDFRIHVDESLPYAKLFGAPPPMLVE